MVYNELVNSEDFQRNMRRTPWLRLFPHWWSENDALLNAIGDEVERIKALAIFGLLNAGIKPPVMIWQDSLKHKEYHITRNLTQLPTTVDIQAPLYKTWGKITLNNNTETDIDGLEITFDDKNGFAINQSIKQSDNLVIDLSNNQVILNGHVIEAQKIGEGMPHFITSQNNKEYKTGTPLHNEVIRLKINTDKHLEGSLVSQTVNVTENIEKWEITGEAYTYNADGVDPWIAIEDEARINYKLDFTNMKQISFWYKGEGTGILRFYHDGELITSKNVTDEWQYYSADMSEFSGEGKIEFESDSATDVIYINDIKYIEEKEYSVDCDIDLDIQLDNVVFENEQNIEITGLELIPIEKVELYVNYDFDYNKSQNGWQKVYQKKYESNTNVIYDMITTHFFTKNFYVDVYFKTIQYPYRVGFPADKTAEYNSMYHVNNRLDSWGEQLGLSRRLYKEEIPEEDYADTFPTYYPFNIEQDFWYYSRLVNEYTWNELAINDVDIKDTDGNNVLRLYSTNPFCEDFAIHAKSIYPTDKKIEDYNEYIGSLITQKSSKNLTQQVQYTDIINLLRKNDKPSTITLNNQNGMYINTMTYQSKELWTYFDLSNLPENVNIDNIEIIVEGNSIDNKKDKISTTQTGLLIPDFDDSENNFIPLQADGTFEIKNKNITYSNSDFNEYGSKIVSSIVDSNIIQEAIIGKFSCPIKDFIKIPFRLKENGEDVNDINHIWLYYNNIIKEGIIKKDESGEPYIYGFVPNGSLMTQLTIVVKSDTHVPFTTTIDIGRKNKYIENEDGEQEVEYQYIEGPLIDGEPSNTQITEEWHTGDLRNLLQRQGVYFRLILENQNQQSSTKIFLYNITLKVNYSPKKSTFDLRTYVNTKDAVLPNVGIYEASIKNTGDKPLNTTIDIISPPNIVLEKNNIDVDLKPGASITENINIKPEYPIVDGFYDILTICEDVVRRNSITVFGAGLIETGIILKPHHGKYNETIKLHAEVTTIDNSILDGDANKVQFYINGYAIGDPVIVNNNNAELEITPGNYSFTGTGILKLEARYLGNTKYAQSRNQSTIFISKNNTRITLDAPSKAIYKGTYEAKATVEYFDGENYLPVDDGVVEFIINDEILSSNTSFVNGIFTTKIDSLENPPGEYTLYAQYSGSNTYSSAEVSQSFEIIGGDVTVFVYDEKCKPNDYINLKATVVDKNNKTVPYGYIDFIIEELGIEILNVEIKDGIAISEDIKIDINVEDDSIKIFDIIAKYHSAKNDDENIYNDASNENNPAHLTVQRASIILEYPSLYQGSQYEPLGFLVYVKDEVTGEMVTDGEISISLPSQNNITISSKIDDDGIARMIYNPISFTAKEWNELNKFKFTTAGDTQGRKDIIDIVKDTNIPETDIVYDKGNLYKIYDGDFNDISLVDFYIENGNLYYKGENSDFQEHIYIGEDNCLYAKTTIDSLRQYVTGLQDIEITYSSSSGQYKNKNINVKNGLNIEKQDVNLDIHSYDLYYTDTDTIVCYVGTYDFDENDTDINIEGSVQFLLDNIPIGDPVQIVSNMAVLNNTNLTTVQSGNHLLCVQYISSKNNPLTYSYSYFKLKKVKPLISIEIDRVKKNRKSNINVILQSPDSTEIPLNGVVNLYMNGEYIDSQYLYGNEGMPGIVDIEGDLSNIEEENKHAVTFIVTMPNDIDIKEYTIKAEFLGNEFFDATSIEKNIKQEPSVVNLHTNGIIENNDFENTNGIFVGLNEKSYINVLVESSDDIINEGIVVLKYGDKIIGSGAVINNNARIEWTPTEKTSYSYSLTYENGVNYINGDKTTLLKITVIDPLNEITIPNDKCKTLNQALMCLKENGTINIDEDIILSESINIDKSCNIIGKNDTAIIKDKTDLVTDITNIPVDDSTNFTVDLYEIKGLLISNLNTNDFAIEDSQLYFKNGQSRLPIYLLEDGKFYSTTKLTIDNVNNPIYININANVNINNLTFKTNDNNQIIDLIIKNTSDLTINHSILHSNIELQNLGELTAQRNLMYCTCTGGGDLDNNWWGSNTAPYKVNSNIILDVNTVNKPAVISEDIDVIGQMIGSNGREYDIPSLDFIFKADSGYFSIDAGKMTNNKAQTSYFDAEKEGNIYLTVDNETVSCPVYSYERKTEVIIDEIKEAPIGYQISLSAKVQSCADTYYTFDENNNIEKSTEVINEGHMSFYLNDKQVGYAKVKNGLGSVNVLFTNQYYNIDEKYEVKVVYSNASKYFDSESISYITLINDNNACYVSSLGDNSNSGSYSEPVATIQQAINLNRGTIYLLDDNCEDTNIEINGNVTIKSYCNHTTFSNLTGDTLFTIQPNASLNISSIDFINNSFNNLFNNQGILQANNCIFYENDSILFKNSGDMNVKYSAIVNNKKIATKIESGYFTYCWFGSNKPNSENINDYVIMDIETSKDIVYIGSVVQVTASLNKYVHDGIEYILEEELPLRIAKFATECGQMQPVKDYTYKNSSTSLLDTNKEVNSNQYIVVIPENTNYIETDVKLECYVHNVYDEAATGEVNFTIHTYDNVINRKAALKNGVATINIGQMPIGKYKIECSYINNEKIYTASNYFNVNKHKIIVTQFEIDNLDNLYYTNVYIELEDNFGNKINDEKINISIDGDLNSYHIVENGIIKTKLTYNLLEAGSHKITIDNYDTNSDYETFYYTQEFISKEKESQIIFDYDRFEARVPNEITIKIVDDENININEGTLSIILDDEEFDSDIYVRNGIVKIPNFKINEVGQHTIIIYYSGATGHYKECIYVNSQISVGIYNVIFGIKENETLFADIGKDFNISTTVLDVSEQPVNQGHINLYIDDILLNEESIPVNDGKFSFSHSLPINIAAGTHSFTIEYIDSMDIYLDTYLHTYLIVGEVPTEIGVNSIYGNPGQKTTVDYSITTAYGNAATGTLTAKYDGVVIGQASVSDSFMNQIVITAPFMPANKTYQITLEYTDLTGNYADSQINVDLILQKTEIVISPSHTWYYPDTSFMFGASFTDKDGNIINVGTASIYIDNIKESDSLNVVNGQISTSLLLNKARTYPVTIVYEDNEYYNQTTYSFDLQIDSVKIDDIIFDNIEKNDDYYVENNIIYSLPNQKFKDTLSFVTLDNYNVKDGIIDIYIDNDLINSFYIAEAHKYVEFNIGDLTKGKHTITLKYHDSGLFVDFEKDYVLEIITQQVQLLINDGNKIVTQAHNDTIDIDTYINKQIDGNLKYYIGVPIYSANDIGNTYVKDYDYKFIGIVDIDRQQNIKYTYRLPSDLLAYAIDNFETQYKIKVSFDGNRHYDKAEAEIDLEILKEDCNINMDSENLIVEYRGTLDIGFDIDIENSAFLNIYIDDELIGSGIVKNKRCDFEYKMNSKYVVKPNGYTVRISYTGSAVTNAFDKIIPLQIIPANPTMKTKEVQAYIGGALTLDNKVIGPDDIVIDNGILTYEIKYQDNNTDTVFTIDGEYQPNNQASIQLPNQIINDSILKVYYQSDDATKYANIEEEIPLKMIKNDVNIDLNVPSGICRGDSFDIEIDTSSSTTIIPVDVAMELEICNKTYAIDNDTRETEITIPLPCVNPIINITSIETDVFKSCSISIPIELDRKNSITINTDEELSSTNAHTMEQAVDLVAENGIIQLIKPMSNEIIELNKNLIIQGPIELEDWAIINNAKVVIKDLTFNTNASVNNIIQNNNEMEIINCSFNNSNNSAILTNDKISIYDCIFTGNNATNGGAIYISNKNKKTIISKCQFNQNHASLNGGCIYSNKGNDVEISFCEFSDNNCADISGSCISVNGNTYMNSNTFFYNDGQDEVSLINGTIEMEKNIFDGSIVSTKIYAGTIEADFNFWGYNNIEDIEANNASISLDNWLIGRAKRYNKDVDGEKTGITVGVIDQYINRLEKEVTNTEAVKLKFPVVTMSGDYELNQEIKTPTHLDIKIGQEVL